ncbi:hypothetical protein [Corynebacterium kalidii]
MTTESTSDYRIVASGAFRSHPTWPWLHLGADGTIWDDARKEYRTPWTTTDGYLKLSVPNGQRFVHRLVLEAWFGEDVYSPERPITRHGNPTRTFNAIWNLRPGTVADNNRDITCHGNHGMTTRKLCRLGHPLVGENLVAAQLKRGKRDCRACARARARVYDLSRRQGIDAGDRMEQYAHEYCDLHIWEIYASEYVNSID